MTTTYTDNTELETFSGWSETERTKAFLLLLQALVDCGLSMKVTADFRPTTEGQRIALKKKMAEFLDYFPDPIKT